MRKELVLQKIWKFAHWYLMTQRVYFFSKQSLLLRNWRRSLLHFASSFWWQMFAKVWDRICSAHIRTAFKKPFKKPQSFLQRCWLDNQPIGLCLVCVCTLIILGNPLFSVYDAWYFQTRVTPCLIWTILPLFQKKFKKFFWCHWSQVHIITSKKRRPEYLLAE